MKRGPNTKIDAPSAKRQKLNADDSKIPNPLLYDEVISNLIQFVPAFSFYGSQKLSTVCKKWHKNIQASDFYSQTKFQRIVDDCMRSPEGVLLILGDEKLIPHLTMEQIGTLCSCHPDLAIHLLNNLKTLLTKISFIGTNYLIGLSRRHLKVAKVVFDTPELCYVLSGHQIAQIGQHCIETAMYILNTVVLRDKLTAFDIATLGQALPEIAHFILNKPQLTAQFESQHLIALGGKQPDIAIHIINTPPYCVMLDCNDLLAFGMVHTKVALHLFNMPEIREKLPLQSLIDLGKSQPEAAKLILSMPHILEELDSNDIVTLGQNQLETTKFILSTPALRKKLRREDLAKLGEHRDDIALYILQTPKLLIRLNEADLPILAKQNPKAALYILQALLFEPQKALIMQICQNHADAIQYVLNTPELHEKLDYGDLEILTEKLLEPKIMLHRVRETLSSDKMKDAIIPFIKNFIDSPKQVPALK